MTDPFERLAGSVGTGPSPDLDAIKLRAHRIRRRRQTGLASAGAVAMAILAVVGVLLATGPEGISTSLGPKLQSTSPPDASQPAVRGSQLTQSDSAESVSGEVGTSSGSAAKGAPAPSAAEGRTTSGGAAVMGPAQDAPDKPELEATLTVTDQMLGRGKTFTLKVCNVTSGTVKRSFGSSQRYDFEVFKEGKLVWRWSDGQVFTQVVGEETWKAKECKTWSGSWDATNSEGGRAPAGDYEAVGILKASPELRTGAVEFSVAAI